MICSNCAHLKGVSRHGRYSLDIFEVGTSGLPVADSGWILLLGHLSWCWLDWGHGKQRFSRNLPSLARPLISGIPNWEQLACHIQE
jgi:hypothetical protein